MSGQLCLKWNNHSISFNKLLNKIYLEDVYSDATILCHGKFYPVHRFVLSTCSEYFEEMFRQCVRLNNKHPFIVVKDVHPEQMEALLNYMYKGEVNVPQEMLPELIKAAETFKIRGLAIPDEEPVPKSRKRAYVSSPSSLSKKSRRQEEKSSSSNLSDTKSNQCDMDDSSSSQLFQNLPKLDDETEVPKNPTESPIVKIKKEQVDEEEPIAIIDVDSPIKQEQLGYETFVEDGASKESFDYDASNDQFDASNDQFDTFSDRFDPNNEQYSEGQESSSWGDPQSYEAASANQNDETQRLSGDLYSTSAEEKKTELKLWCPYPPCSFKTVGSSHLRRHILIHTGEKPFECSQCTQRFSRKGNRDIHFKTIHSFDKRFHCTRCSYKNNCKSNLKSHYFSHHPSE